MKNFPIFLALVLLAGCMACSPKKESFSETFQVLPFQDTLLFSVAQGLGTEAPLPNADTLVNAIFYEQVSDSLHAVIEHILSVEEPVIVKLGRFPLDAQFDGLAIAIKDFWFLNQSILIFDKQLQRVTGLFPVAEYYGGDGGQILQASWLIASNPKQPELIVRISQHSLQLQEDEADMKDVYVESVERYVWQQGAFVKHSTPDSTALIQKFPVEW